MATKYEVVQWVHALAKQNLECSPTVMMTVEDMRNSNPTEITFQSIKVGEYTIEATTVNTENLNVIAKYLIEPYEKNQLKYPLGAYLCALSDQVFSLPFNAADTENEVFNPNNHFYDLRTVKEWVNHFLVMYRENDKSELLECFLQNRIAAAVAAIKLSNGDALADFIESSIDLQYLMEKYENDYFNECELEARTDGKNCKALFQLRKTDEDIYFKADDAVLKPETNTVIFESKNAELQHELNCLMAAYENCEEHEIGMYQKQITDIQNQIAAH